MTRKQEFDAIYKGLRNRLGNGNESLTWNGTTGEVEYTLRRLFALVNRVTYKQGASFVVSLERHGARMVTDLVRLTLTLTVVNILPPHTPTQITASCENSIGDFLCKSDERILREWIYPLIMRAEEHEMREWFKYRGEHVVDPHPSDPILDEYCAYHKRLQRLAGL